MSTVHASVTFSVDRQGRLVVEIISEDRLAQETLSKAIEEFWKIDRDEYASENEAKWLRRL